MFRELPAGRVTFAFVDVVGSTRAFAEHGDEFVLALSVLHELVARHTVGASGFVVKTEGDGAFLAFGSAQSAIDALMGLQAELDQVPLDTVPRLRLRAGAHTGDAVPVANDYVALAVNVAARVTSAAGPGQVVVTAAVQAELSEPAGTCMGDFDLKDVRDPVELWLVAGEPTPLRAPPARRTNVEVPLTEFVGREKEMAGLTEAVAAHRLVTIAGPGGLGKTRLVSEFVLQAAGGIAGGAWMVELAALGDGKEIPAAVAEVLSLHSRELDAISSELQRRGDVVLVLDNCEHVIDAVADLATDLLAICPHLVLLCTSREPLQVPGEHVRSLEPLTDRDTRVALFTQRAEAAGATLPENSIKSVDRLCAVLDGLPLAIEIAATQARSTGLEELIRIAEEGAQDLSRRGGNARQRSLDAVLAWSLDRLPAPRRNALLTLSILPGRFNLAMATTFLGAIPACETEAVRPLAQASLVDLDGSQYRLLDTIRHAARRRLTEEPDLAMAARMSLRAWALGEADREVKSNRRMSDAPKDWGLALELAWEQAIDDDSAGLDKLWSLMRRISISRYPSEAVIDRARRFLSKQVHSEAEIASVAHALDILERHGEEAPISDAQLEELCAHLEASGVTSESSDLHHSLVSHYADRRDVAAAGHHLKAFEAAVDAGVVRRPELIHNLRSWVAYAAGDANEVLLHAERFLLAVREAAKAGSQLDLYLNVSEANVAEALLDLGRAQEALPHALEALRLSPAPSGARRFILVQLARAHDQLGDIEASRAVAVQMRDEVLASDLTPAQAKAEMEALSAYLPGLEILH